MINGKTIIAVIPARGGSKGLPGKNTLPLGGKPLIAWTIESAKNSKYIDRIIVSTDSNEIAHISKEYGADVPFMRPAQLATDESPIFDTLFNVLGSLNVSYDFLCLLQPTSPFRSEIHIDMCIDQAISKGAESCISVCEVTEHPNLMYEIAQSNGRMLPLIAGNINTRRQDYSKYYILNGAIYFISIKKLLQDMRIKVDQSYPFIMEQNHSIDIDTYEDFSIAESLIDKFNV